VHSPNSPSSSSPHLLEKERNLIHLSLSWCEILKDDEPGMKYLCFWTIWLEVGLEKWATRIRRSGRIRQDSKEEAMESGKRLKL